MVNKIQYNKHNFYPLLFIGVLALTLNKGQTKVNT